MFSGLSKQYARLRLWLQRVECVGTTFVFGFKAWSAVQYSGHHVRLWLQSVECRTVQWAPRSSLASKSGVLYSIVGTTFVFGFKAWSAVQYSGHHVRLWLQSVECRTVQWAPRSSLASKSGVLYSIVGTTFVFGFKEWSAVQYSGHHVRLWLQRVEFCTVQWAPRSRRTH